MQITTKKPQSKLLNDLDYYANIICLIQKKHLSLTN